MSNPLQKLGMDGAELDEFLKTRDEVVDYETTVRKDYYILREHPETGIERIKIKNINHYFPLDEMDRRSIGPRSISKWKTDIIRTISRRTDVTL